MDVGVEDGFANVARMIAGNDAEWLTRVLASFSNVIGAETRTLAEDKRLAMHYERMNDAADLLIKKLPMFFPLPSGHWVADAKAAHDALVRLKPLLAINLRSRTKPKAGRGGGPRPNVRHLICARIVVEARRITHPDWVAQADIDVCEACAAYWRACGGAVRGDDVNSWQRHVRQAIADPAAEFRNIVLRAQSASPMAQCDF